MSSYSRYATPIVGVLSPVLAGVFGSTVYMVLTRASQNRDADFVFRLGMTAAAMAVPFLLTLVLALRDLKLSRFKAPAKIGLLIATLSLAMLWVPISGAISRSKQAANLSLDGVPAPDMETVDLNGQTHDLSAYRGKVVLLNIWATWCAPCRKEMPELDRLHKDKVEEGLVILGLSFEDVETQRPFAEEIGVSYPLLTKDGQIPDVFSTTARYPANFLIDRGGRLRPAPSTDEPFENLVRAVEQLLKQ
jgi:thiol-disulfide isomerase/thioredoxin